LTQVGDDEPSLIQSSPGLAVEAHTNDDDA